jgi:hypothetical protein
MPYSIIRITNQENKQWDDLVMSSPQGHTFTMSDMLLAWSNNDPDIYLTRLGCYDDQGILVGGQALLHKRKYRWLNVQALLQTWAHIETPILADHIETEGVEYFSILAALAKKVSSMFFYYKIFSHPTLTDVRPLLYQGWTARPDYAHCWEVTNPATLIQQLKQRKRYKAVSKITEKYEFTNSLQPFIICDFLKLYKATASQLNYPLRPAFDAVFKEMANQMSARNQLRIFSCRRNTGELVAMATYVIHPNGKKAYGWYLAHTPMTLEGDYMPAFYLYAIEVLSTEGITNIDIAEGLHPSLFLYKDSLGTQSISYFVLETPNATKAKYAIETVRRVKERIKRLIL